MKDDAGEAFSNKKHEELQSGEVWIGNYRQNGFDALEHTTKRKGIKAYNEHGTPLSEIGGGGLRDFFPVFAQQEEHERLKQAAEQKKKELMKRLQARCTTAGGVV